MAVAVTAPQFDGLTEEGAIGLRVVPDAMELCDAGGATQNPARDRELRFNAAALAAPGGLGVEARPVGRPRRRPRADREARPHSPHPRNPGKTRSSAVCRRTRYSPASQGRLSMAAQGGNGQAGDPWAESETLLGRSAGAHDRTDGALSRNP